MTFSNNTSPYEPVLTCDADEGDKAAMDPLISEPVLTCDTD